MKTTTIYQLYWCNFIAISTTCRKKHSERLLGLGWHSSTKGQSTRKLQILRGLLDILLFLRYLTTQGVYSHATPYIESACQVRNWDKDCVGGCRFHFLRVTQLPLFSFVNPLLYRLVPSKRTCPIMSVYTVSKIVLSYATEMETTPFRQISTPNRKPFSSPCWTPATPEATFRQIPLNRDSWYLQCCDGRGCKKYSSQATATTITAW